MENVVSYNKWVKRQQELREKRQTVANKLSKFVVVAEYADRGEWRMPWLVVFHGEPTLANFNAVVSDILKHGQDPLRITLYAEDAILYDFANRREDQQDLFPSDQTTWLV